MKRALKNCKENNTKVKSEILKAELIEDQDQKSKSKEII